MNQTNIDQLFKRAVELRGAHRDEFLASLAPAVRSRLETLLECDRTAEENGFMGGGDRAKPTHADPDATLLQTASKDATDQSLRDSSTTENESTFISEHTPEVAAHADLPKRIGRYSVTRFLAQGGLGAVYLGEHPNLEEMNADGELVPQRVAIKVGRRKTEAAEQEMVKREASVLCSLDHQHIARVQDLDFEDGLPHLVMEYVSGGSLGQKVKSAPLEVSEAVTLMVKVCRAIQYAHDKQILHRDLKPDNILVTQQGEPKVIDFGLAALRSAMQDHEDTIPGGTIRYMSPEQAAHARANLLGSEGNSQVEDVRVDVFSLGAILYELLTEKRLYEFKNSEEGLDRAVACSIDTSPLDKPDIPASVKAACLKALAKDKGDRFRSAAAFADAIDPKADRRPFPKKAIAAAVVAIALLTAFVLSRPSTDGQPAQAATEVTKTELVFGHFANGLEDTADAGILFKNGAARENDDLRIDASFADPTYCYLIAMNPDGVIQLCYPESEDETQPEPIDELHFPADPESGFRFTDGTGQQMFLLVQSNKKLPAFRDWRDVLGKVDWSNDSGDWLWKKNRLQAVNSTRGTVSKLKGAEGFTSLCRRVEQKVGIELEAVSFPIVER